MEKVPEKNETKRADYVLTSIEALKGSSGEEISDLGSKSTDDLVVQIVHELKAISNPISDHEDPQMFALSQAAGRLRGIIALVNSGYLTMEILLNNLEAAARKSYGNYLEF